MSLKNTWEKVREDTLDFYCHIWDSFVEVAFAFGLLAAGHFCAAATVTNPQKDEKAPAISRSEELPTIDL